MIKYHAFFIITGGKLRLKPNLSQSFLSQGRGSHRLPLVLEILINLALFMNPELLAWVPQGHEASINLLWEKHLFKQTALLHALNFEAFSRRCRSLHRSLVACRGNCLRYLICPIAYMFRRDEDRVQQIITKQGWQCERTLYSERSHLLQLKIAFLQLFAVDSKTVRSTILWTACTHTE